MRRFLLAAVAGTALLSGCVVVPHPYAAGAAPPPEYPAYPAYPTYYSPWSFGLYLGWPFLHFGGDHHHGRGGGWHRGRPGR